MIKKYNYKEYPENSDHNNDTQRPSSKSSYREQHVTKFSFTVNVGLRKGDAMSVISFSTGLYHKDIYLDHIRGKCIN